MSTKFEIEKFNGKGDFSLWKRKMKALLVQQKVAKALDKPPKWPARMTEEEISDACELANSTITLYLADNVLRRLGEINDVAVLWAKLDEFYLSKSTANIVYLKELLFGFKMDPSKSLEENLDQFTKICSDIEDTGEELDSMNQAVILLRSLPDKFSELKTVIRYSTEKLTLERVLSTLRSKDLELKIEKKKDSEALFMKGKSEKFAKGQSSNSGKNNSKSAKKKNKEQKVQKDQNDQKQKKKSFTCNYCKAEGHIKYSCPVLKRMGMLPVRKPKADAHVLDGYDSAEVLMAGDSDDRYETQWIMDSGCTFHISPYKHHL